MMDFSPDIPALIQQCAPNVAVQTLRPLISVESGKRSHAIGYKVVANDGSVFRLTTQPKNTNEAKQWATWFLANGYRFDAGIAQVNTVNFKATGLTVETMFEPCANIRAGAQVLTDCYTRAWARFKHEQTALRAALSCYQSGNFQTGFATGYVAKILASESGASSRRARDARPDAQGNIDNVHSVSSEVPGWGGAANGAESASKSVEQGGSKRD